MKILIGDVTAKPPCDSGCTFTDPHVICSPTVAAEIALSAHRRFRMTPAEANVATMLELYLNKSEAIEEILTGVISRETHGEKYMDIIEDTAAAIMKLDAQPLRP